MKRADLAEVREVIADRKRRFMRLGSRNADGEGWKERLAKDERTQRTTELLEMMAAELEATRTC